jgi:hypothetical protein
MYRGRVPRTTDTGTIKPPALPRCSMHRSLNPSHGLLTQEGAGSARLSAARGQSSCVTRFVPQGERTPSSPLKMYPLPRSS